MGHPSLLTPTVRTSRLLLQLQEQEVWGGSHSIRDPWHEGGRGRGDGGIRDPGLQRGEEEVSGRDDGIERGEH